MDQQQQRTSVPITKDAITGRELKDSLLLLVLAAASVGTYIAVGVVAVRVFAR
jgi:hypothetical protein